MDDDQLDNDAFAEPAGAKKVKGDQPPGRRAIRSLRRARSIYQEAEWHPSVEADFLVREATVLALLDLVEAVRDQSGQRSQ